MMLLPIACTKNKLIEEKQDNTEILLKVRNKKKNFKMV